MSQGFQVATPVFKFEGECIWHYAVDSLEWQEDHADESGQELPDPVVWAHDLQQVRLSWDSRTGHPDIEVAVVINFDIVRETWQVFGKDFVLPSFITF